MLRIPVVPAMVLFATLLTGCQTMLKPEDSSISRNKPDISDNTEQTDSGIVHKPVSKTHEKPELAQEKVQKKVQVKVQDRVIQTPSFIDGRLVLGLAEEGYIPSLDLSIPAKIDTGAENTSVDARNIQYFERDSKKWVKFSLHRTSRGITPLELPLIRTTKIKRPGSSSVSRPVVSLSISIGEIAQQTEITLTDRSKYKYPLLIGRNFIQDLAIVDVSQNKIASESVLKQKTRIEKVVSGTALQPRTIQQPVSVDGLARLGAIEYISIGQIKSRLKARIDTGALTSSLDARDLELFRKNNQNWVRFTLKLNDSKPILIEQPVTRFVLIKRHGTESEKRPVITMNVSIGPITKPTEFSLRDRESYEYPVLIGVRFLENAAIVDVSQNYIAENLQRGS